MIIDITTLENNVIDIGFQIPKSYFQDDPEFVDLVSPVNTIIHLEKSGERVFVNGSFNTRLRIDCSRCLNSYIYIMKADFECEFLPISKRTSPTDKIELSEEEMNIVWYNNTKLDLSEQVRQNIILNIPMKPLCTFDCKGLCNQCGENLNKGKCKCIQMDNIQPFYNISKIKLP